jgi:large subunit ribosomal protein L13
MAPSTKTYVAKPSDRERNWLLVDANGKTLGRLATQVADLLRCKRKPEYTQHIDTFFARLEALKEEPLHA